MNILQHVLKETGFLLLQNMYPPQREYAQAMFAKITDIAVEFTEYDDSWQTMLYKFGFGGALCYSIDFNCQISTDDAVYLDSKILDVIGRLKFVNANGKKHYVNDWAFSHGWVNPVELVDMVVTSIYISADKVEVGLDNGSEIILTNLYEE